MLTMKMIMTDCMLAVCVFAISKRSYRG